MNDDNGRFDLGDMMTDFEFDTEMDATERAHRLSDDINASIARYTVDIEGNQRFCTPWDEVGGIPDALAVDMAEDDDPVRLTLQHTITEHFTHPSPGDPRGNCYVIVDPCLDDEGRPTLPPWSPHGPAMQNVVLALIAGRTFELRPLRGAFTGWVLAAQIRNGDIETVCSLRVSPRCTPHQPREIFTQSWGNYVVFFRVCAPCYFDFFERSTSTDGGYQYDSQDPREYGEPEFRDGDLGGSIGDIQP